jgi:NAD+ kinase
MIITVGGDGTFLEAAHHVRHETVWGINSDPVWSVGRFCSGNAGNFEVLLEKILAGGAKITKLNRLKISFGKGHPPMNVMNDILVCHQNPAAMSRYYLKVGRIKEEQRSSGVWIATAAGSSGGIRSAGGRLLPQESRDFLYKPRELYQGKNTDYQLKGDVLKPDQKLAMTSLMRDGVVYVDGSHVRVPFTFSADITVQRSPEPLKVIIE